MKFGYWSLAASRFGSALARRTDYIGALFGLAWVSLSLGRPEESEKYYRRCVLEVPNSSEGHHGLGCALQRLGRHQEAIDAFKIALELNPNSSITQYNLAESLLACGNIQDAFVLYRRVARLEPENAEAVGNFGATLARLGHWEEALEPQRRAMALEPNATHAHNLAVTLFELERFREAEQALRHALELSPEATELELRLAITMAENGAHEEAVATVTHVLSKAPDDLVALMTKSAVLIIANQLDRAIEAATEAVRKHSSAAGAHEALAYAYLRRGDASAALQEYERAIALDPENFELYAGRGATLSSMGNHSAAVQSFKAVLERAPGFFDRHQEFGRYFRESEMTLARERN